VSAVDIKSMTPEEILQLPIREYRGPVRMVSSERELEQAVRELRLEKVVGLDTETRPTFKKGEFYLPSLVQIAASSAVYLFQLKKMDFSAALTELFENARLIKAGIGLKDDFKNLNKVFPFVPQNVVDLSFAARAQGFQQSSVRSLAGQLLGFRVTKGTATSNWANAHLSPKQISYAATDAWVCRELFLRFQQLNYLDDDGNLIVPEPGPEAREDKPSPQ
jgi:ribonuclease D